MRAETSIQCIRTLEGISHDKCFVTNALVDKSMNNVFWEFKRCSVRTLNLYNILTKTLIFADLGTVGASEALRCTQSKKTWNDGATFPVEVDFPHFWAETTRFGIMNPRLSPLKWSNYVSTTELWIHHTPWRSLICMMSYEVSNQGNSEGKGNHSGRLCKMEPGDIKRIICSATKDQIKVCLQRGSWSQS